MKETRILLKGQKITCGAAIEPTRALLDQLLAFAATAAAKQAYYRYSTVVGFKNFQGNPLPTWDELPEIIKEAWAAAAAPESNYSAGGIASLTIGDTKIK